MKIVNARRTSQVFFFVLFVWFCIVSTVGERFHQLGGWPINWFLQMDPLAAIATVLSTHSLYGGFLWAVSVVVLTIIFGRFFCGWVCPFGSLHHFFGCLGKRGKTAGERIRLNRYRSAQRVKYYILIFFLAMCAFPSAAASVQIGLLDPIVLVTRSFNLVIVPIADKAFGVVTVAGRFYEWAWLIVSVFTVMVLLNFVVPRFFCRFICPLGALFGIIDRLAVWRIGQREGKCTGCKVCEQGCEGGCEPSGVIRISECVLCFNCLDDCTYDAVGYGIRRSSAGEITNPDVSRRGVLLSLASGVFGVGAVRLGGKLAGNWHHGVIRPPGALPEEEFLKRCIKCGQCMRVCPTNVIQPAGFAGGFENLWTPVLNNRIGTSGCQLNCVACGQVCPTAAIRPISLDEKRGTGEFAGGKPVKLGTAFVDRSRCLAWAMGRPCIVCQENCPVSPKAIFTRATYETVRDGVFHIKLVKNNIIETEERRMVFGEFTGGDYFLKVPGWGRKKIASNTKDSVIINDDTKAECGGLEKGTEVEIQVRLLQPYVDAELCIGCGICEHECPVSGRPAIRVSAEGESRSTDRKMLL